MKYIAQHITVEDWWTIDNLIDSSISIDVVEGDVLTAMRGSVVRDAGWRASFHKGGDRFERGWPPGDVLLEVELPSDHWAFVLEQLERWREVEGVPDLATVIGKVRGALSARL